MKKNSAIRLYNSSEKKHPYRILLPFEERETLLTYFNKIRNNGAKFLPEN